jgi:hypothetical protein
MDQLNSVMVRLALLWLLVGFVIGGTMLVDRAVPGDWRAWLAPGHGHMLFVGWFLQFAFGIAYWLLPRKRSPDLPMGYDERLAYSAVAMLNAGLVLRLSSEPFERVGDESNLTLAALFASALLQIVAALIFVRQLWSRAAPRVRSRVAPRAKEQRES